ncbi:MAG TPA: FtsX-like permease family protein [Acidimicrobiales bacterium]|nr:FtsX-like permease family protein [Acidimicrobiales bacterium]
MIGSLLGESVYRFRATFARRWTGYLSLLVLIGLVGGISMAAIAGARRTQSSFPVYEASTNPADVQTFVEFAPATGIGFSQRVNHEIARLPYVTRATPVVGFDGNLQVLSGLGGQSVPGEAFPAIEGSPGGEYVTSDRVTVLQGRLLDPSRLDEFMLSAGAARGSNLHLGSTVRLAFFTDSQSNSPTFAGYPTDKPNLLITLKLVGIVENDAQVVQSDDQALGDQFGVVSPALTRRLEGCCAYYSYLSLTLDGGMRHAGAVEADLNRMLPHLRNAGGSQTAAPTVATAERAIRPEAIAFGVFGVVAALAALMIGGQVLSRLIRREGGDRAVLRALGAGPAMTTADALGGVLVALVAGAVLAVAVAVALSPLAPIGPVRAVYPDKGVSFDWTVFALGFLVLVVGLGGCALLVAYRSAPHRVALRGALRGERGARMSRTAAAAALPPNARLGLEAALGATASRRSAPVRSALVGTVLAVVLLVATIVFGSSLNSLVSQPAQYGWNWDYALLSGFSGAEDLPGTMTTALLAHDTDVAHFAGVYFELGSLDGQHMGMLAMRPGASVVPSQLSGQSLSSAGQIVVGPATLAALHKHVGQTVVFGTDTGHSYRLRIVGTATLPTIGGSGQPKMGMGTGAVVAWSLFSANDLNQQGSPVVGPMAELISMRPGVGSARALASLNAITRRLNAPSDGDGPVGGVVAALRPAEVATYGSAQGTPALLAAVLALAAIGALGLTLTASVRSRRREFALLKALGFTRRQLASTVGWQSTTAAVLGVVVGLPVGLALGRWLWTLFAEGINAVPLPHVPVFALVAVGLGAVVFANLVALAPARIAARTPTAVLLRSE